MGSRETLLEILYNAESRRVLRARLVAATIVLGWSITYIAAASCVAVLLTDSTILRYLLVMAFLPVLYYRMGSATWKRVFRRSSNEVARALEAGDSQLKGRIRPAADLAGHLPPGTSPSLADAAQEHAVLLLQERDSAKIIGARAPLPLRPALLGILTGAFLLSTSHGSVFEWMKRTQPWLDPPRPAPMVLSVAPGDTVVSRDAAVHIGCSVAYMGSETPRLMIRRAGELDRVELFSRSPTRGEITRCSATVAHAGSGFRYLCIAGEDSSSWFTVGTYAPLRLTDIEVTYEYPAYTGLEELSVRGNVREIRAVTGTRAAISLSTNNALEEGWLQASSKTEVDSLIVSGTEARGGLMVNRREQVVFGGRDVWGQETEFASIAVEALQDAPPVIKAVAPGRDALLSREMRVDVGVEASDDYGISLARVRYAAGDVEDEFVLAEGALGKEGVWTSEWSLEKLGLLPDDVVSYRFEVLDNDVVSGPKLTASDWFRLRFPSLTEIVAGIERDQEGVIDSLETLSEDGQEIYQELRDIAGDLAGAETATWGEREDLKELAERQKELASRLGELANEMAELERKSEESDLLPVELLERVTQVQHLLQELDMPELKEALSELQDAIDELSPEEIERALSRLASQQEKILSSLDRTIKFLEQLHTAQQLSHLVREAERLTEEQETIVDSADARPPEASNKVAEREDKIAEDLSAVDHGIEQVAEEMQEFAPSFSESLTAALDRLREKEIEEALKQAAEHLRAGSTEQATGRQKQALAGLQQLTSDLQAAEGSLMNNGSQQMREAVDSAAETVLELSREQEGLVEGDLPPEHAHRRQLGITEAMRILRESLEEVLAQGAGPAASELLGLMARAQLELDRAALKTSATQSSSQKQRSLEALNRVAGALSALQDQMESAGSSCSGSMSMEQLFGLSQEQGQLNASCRSLLPKAGDLSPEVLSSMGARQRMIQEELARLAERMRGEGQIMGDLGSVGRDMDEVIERLAKSGLDEDVVQRQRKILSRLLDAQKSIRRQGVARRRRAVTATRQTVPPVDVSFEQPEGTPSPQTPPPPRTDDSYPLSYRALIDAYFRAVEEK